MREFGVSAWRIGIEEGVSPRAAYGIETRYRYQKSGKDLPRSGRPPALTDRDKRHIKRSIEIDPFITTKQIKASVGLTCHIRTITRWLRKEGIMHSRALRRPFLKDEHAEQRLAWALEYIDKPIEWWKLVVFSDESTIARGEGEKEAWVFCRKVSYKNPYNTTK